MPRDPATPDGKMPKLASLNRAKGEAKWEDAEDPRVLREPAVDRDEG